VTRGGGGGAHLSRRASAMSNSTCTVEPLSEVSWRSSLTSATGTQKEEYFGSLSRAASESYLAKAASLLLVANTCSDQKPID
jgi:hypothetical protein